MANEIARKLRKTMTPQEVRLWVRLRELRTLGHHFRRQSPILTYIVDFECRRSESLSRWTERSMVSTQIENEITYAMRICAVPGTRFFALQIRKSIESSTR